MLQGSNAPDLLKVNVNDYLSPNPVNLGHSAEVKMREARKQGVLTVEEEIGIRGRCKGF